MRFIVRLIMFFASITLLLTGTLMLARHTEAKTQWVLFGYTDGRDTNLFRVRPEGGGYKQLTNYRGDEEFRWVSKSGWIYFIRPPHSLYRMRLNGSHTEELLDNVSINYRLWPDEKNDALYLYLDDTLGARPHLYRVRLSDGLAEKLPLPAEKGILMLRFTRDGYYYWWDGDGGGDFYWTSFDATEIRRLTTHGDVQLAGINTYSDDRLYYTRELIREDGREVVNLYSIDLDSGDVETLIENAVTGSIRHYPDTEIYYATYVGGSTSLKQVYRLNIATGERRYITMTSEYFRVVHQSDDWVYYTLDSATSILGTPTKLYRLNLTEGAFAMPQVAWEAYMSFVLIPHQDKFLTVAFTDDRRSRFGLYLLDPTTQTTTPVIENIMFNFHVLWSKNFTAFVYLRFEKGSYHLDWLNLTTLQNRRLTTIGPNTTGLAQLVSSAIPEPVEKEWQGRGWLIGVGLLLLGGPLITKIARSEKWRSLSIRPTKLQPQRR